MKTIRILIGLPRSGKTTWIQNNKTNEVIISADDLRYLVYNQKFWADGEPQVWYVRSILLKYIMSQGVNIIIDETNTLKQRREPIIRLAKQNGYKVIGIVCTTSKDRCICRAKQANQEDLIPIIEKMSDQYEIPIKDEGFDEIYLY